MQLVIGATGNIGRRAVAALLRQGEQVRALTRRPDAAGLPVQAHVVGGDLDDRASVVDALRGVQGVFAVTAGPAKPVHDELIGSIAAAMGIHRVVAVSSLAVDEDPTGALGDLHLRAELAIGGTGVPHTVLRPNGLYTNVFGWATAISTGRPIPVALPDLPAAHVDPGDVAEVGSLLLTSEQSVPEVLRLTGPAALTPRDQVAILGGVLDRPVELKEITLAEERERMITNKVPPAVADAVLAARAAGGTVRATVFDDVATVLGRSATPFADFVAAHRDRLAHP